MSIFFLDFFIRTVPYRTIRPCSSSVWLGAPYGTGIVWYRTVEINGAFVLFTYIFLQETRTVLISLSTIFNSIWVYLILYLT